MIDIRLTVAIAYLVLGVALLIGGIIVPLVYTVIPLSKTGNGGCPSHLAWRIVLKLMLAILVFEEAFIRLYVLANQAMPPPSVYRPFDLIVLVVTTIALIATWITHPDGIRSV